MENTKSKTPLSEGDLRVMAQSLSATFDFSKSDDSDEQQRTWLEDRLAVMFDTATAPNLSAMHRTAACNVLCGAIEKCLVSSNDSFVSYASSDAILENLHMLYFELYHTAKEKSMKQVLGTILKLQTRNAALVSSSQSLNRSVKYILRVLFRKQDRTKAKPALHTLQQYVSRDLIRCSQLLTAFHQSDESSSHPSNGSCSTSTLDHFVAGILDWVQFSDVASSVGQFIASFFEAIAKDPLIIDNLHPSNKPLWMEPLIRCIANHSDHIQAFKTYVLPSLFRHNPGEYLDFLQYLRVEKHLGLTQTFEVDEEQRSRVDSTTERLAMFAALQVGKELGLVAELDRKSLDEVDVKDGVVRISEVVLGRLLDHASHEVRLSGLKLLATSSYSTRPFSAAALKFLARSLPSFFEEADPNFRGEVLSTIQTLVRRLRVISAALSKTVMEQQDACMKPASSIHHTSRLLYRHKAFATWFIRFLTSEIHPAASYQRHISSLKSLVILLKSGLDSTVPPDILSRQAKLGTQWPFHLNVICPRSKRVLLDALLDPFDDVRQTALECLKLSVGDLRHTTQTISDILENSTLLEARRLMAHSGRLDHSDGVARLYDLLTDRIPWLATSDTDEASIMAVLLNLLSLIQEAVGVAKTQLSTAVSRYPIHGYFTAMRYILDQSSGRASRASISTVELVSFLDKTFSSLTEIWTFVKPILCDDAPEGFIPLDVVEEPGLTTKDILSFSWRALKESSLLLRTLVNPAFVQLDSQDTEATMQRLMLSGDLCFTQLAELRHRGAFSTVAQTFAAICRQCVLSTAIETQLLPYRWYKRTLALIEQKGAVTTRRSAGIPALIVGILMAEPKAPLLEDVMRDLQEIAMRASPSSLEREAELPQVHALNSLKAVFSNSILGDNCERFIVEVMDVAATCLGSDVWAVRNCGLMLFRGLIDRLLGSHESLDDSIGANHSRTSRLSYERYPGLLELVNRLLATEKTAKADSSAIHHDLVAPLEATFTVLDLVRRAPPKFPHLSRIRDLVLRAMQSPHWHIRDLAARAFAASLGPSESFDAVDGLLQTEFTNQNEVHGRLLCIRYIITAFVAELRQVTRAVTITSNSDYSTSYIKTGEIDRSLASILELSQKFAGKEMCSPVQASYLRVLNSYGQLMMKMSAPRKATQNSYASSHVSLLTRISEWNGTALACARRNFIRASTVTAAFAGKQSTVEKELELYRCLAFLINDETRERSSNAMNSVEAIDQNIFSHGLGDPEILQYVLGCLDSALQDANVDKVQRLAQSFASSLQITRDIQIVRAGEMVLLMALKHVPPSKLCHSDSLCDYLANLDVKSRFEADQIFHNLEHDLLIWGSSLPFKSMNYTISTASLAKEVEAWLEVVELSLSPLNDVSLRLAAIQSMAGFVPIVLDTRPLPIDLRLKLCLAAYNALNDDDDELRTLAAAVASVLLTTEGDPESRKTIKAPAVARRLLLEHVGRFHGTSRWLIPYAIDRLLRGYSTRDLQSVPEEIRDIMTDDGVLFAVEKQNLYIDEVREAKLWSTLLQTLPVKSASPRGISRLTSWVLDGIDTLVEMADSQEDGALGWTSNADTFALGMRVIRGAEVLLAWRSKSKKVRVQTSTILMKLQKFSDIAKAKCLHELWLETLEAVLRKTIRARFGKLVLALESLPVSIVC